jgi:beta-N-acetylhexosaminidase
VSRAPAAIILDCEGTALTAEEKRFFTALNPYGFILFQRNCESPAQVKALVAEFKSCVGREEVPILIDQEGGRVARLKAPHWPVFPAAAKLSALGDAAKAVYLNGRLIAHELASLGINVDCAPVADVPVEGAHDVIGDRAYGRDPEAVAKLAGEMAKGLMDGGVMPVIKHVPGHGRARADSHLELPVVEASAEELRKIDFVPFKRLAHLPMAMTAHVVFPALDAKRMATLSPAVIRIIREEIGFKGLLMSDDLSMKAMTGSLQERAQAALAAGCDVVMHCNGTLDERKQAGEGARPMTAEAEARSAKAFASVSKAKALDIAETRGQLERLLSQAA